MAHNRDGEDNIVAQFPEEESASSLPSKLEAAAELSRLYDTLFACEAMLVGKSAEIDDLCRAVTDAQSSVKYLWKVLGGNIATTKAVSSNLTPEHARLSHILNPARAQRREPQVALTGLADLDNALGGLREGEVVLLAGRRHVGTSSLARNVAVNAAKRGSAVALFSSSADAASVARGILRCEARMEITDDALSTPFAQEGATVEETTLRLSELNLFIDDDARPSLSAIECRATLMFQEAEKHGAPARVVRARPRPEGGRCYLGGNQQPAKLIVIDCLQDLAMPDTLGEAEYAGSEWRTLLRGLRRIARSLDSAVLVVSHISGVSGRKPQMSDFGDLQEALEQCADAVMLLDRSLTAEEAQLEGRPALGTADLTVGRNRCGESSKITLAYTDTWGKFMDYVDCANL